MATTAQVNNFISKIAPIIQKYAPKYGVSVVSPIIAQACLESAYGTSSLASKSHNYFGLKYHASVSELPAVTKDGFEQNADGSYVTSSMSWCAFSTMEKGVEGYFKFLFGRSGVTRYNNLKGITDPKTYLETIRSDGYATSLNYVNNNMNVVNKYQLTKYDTLTSSTTSYTQKDFIKEVQSALGVTADGIAGPKTLAATVTVSVKINNKHKVVKPMQKYLNSLGYNCGTADGVAGAKFDAALKKYQSQWMKNPDGEATAKGTIWKKLLGLV